MKPAKKKKKTEKAGRSYYYLIAGSIAAVILVAAVYFLVLNPTAPETALSLYNKSLDLADKGQYQQALVLADQALAKNDSSLTGVIQANRAGILVMLGNYTGAIEAADVANAGSLYSKSVDLANAGQYKQSLILADQALAKNDTSLLGLIQADRAGILVMLGNYTGAIEAADVAINVPGNLTETHSIAWFNKGNALKRLGRISEAKAAYANATAINPAEFPTPGI